MEKKFRLTNVVLYAKGWYKISDDIIADLIQILQLDNYSPYTKFDVYSILLNSFQNSNIYRITDLIEVVNGIHPYNCWKYGYYTKDNCDWTNIPKDKLPNYEMEMAVIYYIISCLRLLDSENWIKKTPRYTKYPIGDNVTIRKVFEQFIQNK